MSRRLKRFDALAGRRVTALRGLVYGHPRVNFRRIQALKAVIAECPDPLAREALELLAIKIARLIESPWHLDSWIDIAGGARTGVMVTDSLSARPARRPPTRSGLASKRRGKHDDGLR